MRVPRLLRFSAPSGLGALLLAGLVGGCATQRGPETGVLMRTENFPLMVEAGLAVAPVASVQPVADASELSALMSNQLYAALLVTLPGTEVISPDDVLFMMKTKGEGALESFREARRKLVAGKLPSKQDLADLSQIVQHRYLLVPWVTETKKEGMQEMSTDYTEAGYALDVERNVYEQVQGRMEGVIVDLWQHELLFRGAVAYETQRMFAENKLGNDEMERARSSAANRFAALVGTR